MLDLCWSFLGFFGCVLFSKIKLLLVWVCLAIFLCFIFSFFNKKKLSSVFKRINYPVLNWVNPVWVPLVFFLVMLLFYDLWCLVSCVWFSI